MAAEFAVSRSAQRWPDRLRAYRLIVDGRAVAAIKRGESVAVVVEPGAHRIWMRIDWCRSRIFEIELADNERVTFACRSGVRFFLFPLYVTFLRACYIELRQLAREPLA